MTRAADTIYAASMHYDYTERDGHWLVSDDLTYQRRGLICRRLWLEYHGAILPGSTQTRRACQELLCVNPDHWPIRSPWALWARLRRAKADLLAAIAVLEAFRSREMTPIRWTDPLWCPPVEVRRLASILHVDPLTVVAAWSVLVARQRAAKEREAQRQPAPSRAAEIAQAGLDAFGETP